MINKTSDKNVANVTKRDIDILNALINVYEARLPGCNELMNSEVEALKNILAEREQDKKRIQELEEERQIVGMPVRNKRSGKIGVILHKWESGSIAVLEKISPRVINTHENMSTLEVITDKVIQEQTIDNVEGGDKNVAQNIEFLKSNEADALYFRGNPKLKSAVESVLERNKELEEVIENSISMQRVENKIEELGISDEDINIKHVLQELLGESKWIFLK